MLNRISDNDGNTYIHTRLQNYKSLNERLTRDDSPPIFSKNELKGKNIYTQMNRSYRKDNNDDDSSSPNLRKNKTINQNNINISDCISE